MTTPTAAQRKSLRELRESTGTLFAKNNTNKKITCNTEQVKFELDAPGGGPNTIAYVPKECLNQAGFLRLWAKGSITISDDEDMQNEIALLGGSGTVEFRPKIYSVDNKTGQQIEVEPEITGKPSDRDMVFREVGDPNQTRGYSIQSNNECVYCHAPVFLQQQFIDEGEPPLCQDHAHLKSQVASTPQPDGTWYHQPIQMQPVQQSNLPAGG